jgi:two-component system, OmpR family, response regulator
MLAQQMHDFGFVLKQPPERCEREASNFNRLKLSECAMPATLSEHQPALGASATSRRFRVLCVDDNRDCADSTVKLLEIVGFEARACYDGATALAEVKKHRFDVYFLDLYMPGMNGDQLANRLRELLAKERPIVVAMTDMSDEETSCRIAAAGFDLHLIKPVDAYKLVQVVDTMFHVWYANSQPFAVERNSLSDT